MSSNRAFSLVELSIVLVILGLMTGGVLVGQNLIEAAQKRKFITFHQETISSIMSFRDKYMALPGDMTNATSFWGRSNLAADNCTSQPGTASATGTCNGNGDGFILYSGHPNETSLLWHHLRLAGMVSGTQQAETNNTVSAGKGPLFTPGQATNVVSYMGGWTTTGSPAILYGDGMSVGGSVTKGLGIQTALVHPTGWWMNAAFLIPEYVWNIDTKVDDGNPIAGRFYGMLGSDPTNPVSTYITSCLTGSGSSYQYNVTYTSNACRTLWMVQ